MPTSNLIVLTPTRNRLRCFSLLESYVAAQTLPPKRWLVCNDGHERYEYNMSQKVILRNPWKDTLPSICHNYLRLLEEGRDGERFVFMEDDDWYRADYLELMNKLLDKADLVGLTPSHYYHVGNRAYCDMGNREHASLASTACTRAVLPLLLEACRAGDEFIDLYLWQHWTGTKRLRYTKPPRYVGMKGCWGEPGIGIGHNLIEPVDAKGTQLRKWLGSDAGHYWTEPRKKFDVSFWNRVRDAGRSRGS